jgi:hypothetical protein|tara:strand:+ start:313 stop:474 length:162 start_codon:yes stop_codon:yes gene_type:complete
MVKVHRMLPASGIREIFERANDEEYDKHVRISYGGDIDTQKKATEKLTDILNS